MFKYFQHTTGTGIWILKDSDFEVSAPQIQVYGCLYSVIDTYNKRNLPILPNLVEYCKSGGLQIINGKELGDRNLRDTLKRVKLNLRDLDRIFPDANYEQKYYNCIVNKLQRFHFGTTGKLIT